MTEAAGTDGTAPQKPRPVGLRPWQPGQSGNPGGMPKGLGEVRAAARAHTALAMETLARCCRDDSAPWAARVTAAEALLSRGWGRPLQPVEISDARPLADVPAERLLQALESLAVPAVVEGER